MIRIAFRSASIALIADNFGRVDSVDRDLTDRSVLVDEQRTICDLKDKEEAALEGAVLPTTELTELDVHGQSYG